MASDANRRAKRASAFLLFATSFRKFNLLLQAFKRVLNLTFIDEGEGLNGVGNLKAVNHPANSSGLQ